MEEVTMQRHAFNFISITHDLFENVMLWHDDSDSPVKVFFTLTWMLTLLVIPMWVFMLFAYAACVLTDKQREYYEYKPIDLMLCGVATMLAFVLIFLLVGSTRTEAKDGGEPMRMKFPTKYKAANFLAKDMVEPWEKALAKDLVKEFNEFEPFGGNYKDANKMGTPVILKGSSEARLLFPGTGCVILARRNFPEKTPKWKSCAVVSNSGLLKNTQAGKHIDDHEMVLRFNAGAVGGPHANTAGSKRGLRMDSKVGEGEQFLYRRWNEGCTTKTRLALEGEPLWISRDWEKMMAKEGANRSLGRNHISSEKSKGDVSYSSGMLGLLAMLQMCEGPLDVYCFENFGYGSPQFFDQHRSDIHYSDNNGAQKYGATNRVGVLLNQYGLKHGHPWGYERKIMNGLVKAGKIRHFCNATK